MERNCGTILQKGKNKDVPLPEKDRKTLIKHAHAYLSLKCENVRKQHIVQVAKTLVTLVPSLIDTTEGEFEGFGVTYDFLNKKFRNQKYLNKKDKADDGSNAVPNEVPTEKDVVDALKFLKTVVASDKNMDEIHSKLVITAARRKEMIKMPKVDFLTEFPTFFTHPVIVRISKLFYVFIIH